MVWEIKAKILMQLLWGDSLKELRLSRKQNLRWLMAVLEADPNARAIRLNNGLCTVVDKSDFILLFKKSWRVDRTSGYVCRSILKTQRSILMHREIMGGVKGFYCDHINGVILDNRRSNLRLCRGFENNRNRKIHKNSTTGIKGAQIFGKRFRAQIVVGIPGTENYKRITIGCFDTAKEAGDAYAQAAKTHHGEFARTI